MHKALLALLCIALPASASAAAFVCSPEAAAFVEDGAGRRATSGAAETSRTFVATDEGGSWGVKLVGSEQLLFDRCVVTTDNEPSYCDRSEAYAGSWLMMKDRTFSAVWMTRSKDRSVTILAKGRCSRI